MPETTAKLRQLANEILDAREAPETPMRHLHWRLCWVPFPMNEPPFSKPITMVLFLKILVTFLYIYITSHSTSKKAAGVAGPLRALPNVRILQRRIRVKRRRSVGAAVGKLWPEITRERIHIPPNGKKKITDSVCAKRYGICDSDRFQFRVFLAENVL